LPQTLARVKPDRFNPSKFVFRGGDCLLRAEDIEEFVEALPQSRDEAEMARRENRMLQILVKLTEITGVEYYVHTQAPGDRAPGGPVRRMYASARVRAREQAREQARESEQARIAALAAAAEPKRAAPEPPADAAAEPKRPRLASSSEEDVAAHERRLAYTLKAVSAIESVSRSEALSPEERTAIRASIMASLV
jgi:hypothetical protein